MTTMQKTSLTAVAFALLTGCASENLSQTELMNTHAAIQSTEELGGAEDPQASLHLKYARDQLDRAQKLIEDGEEKEAARMLDRAHADAELALALARTKRSQDAAQEARAEVEELQTQAQRR